MLVQTEKALRFRDGENILHMYVTSQDLRRIKRYLRGRFGKAIKFQWQSYRKL